jgi:hypothetical protein
MAEMCLNLGDIIHGSTGRKSFQNEVLTKNVFPKDMTQDTIIESNKGIKVNRNVFLIIQATETSQID